MRYSCEVSRGFVLVVSAPSGTGKTILCDRLRDENSFVTRSVSLTTRTKRDGEVSGKDYEFVNRSEFVEKRDRGHLLESAEVFGNLYGTPREPVEKAISDGKVIVMDIDTVGADSVREKLGRDSVSVFILPPSLEELEKRLRLRGKDSPEVLKTRLSEATYEISKAGNYDFTIVNDDLEHAYKRLHEIVISERQRSFRVRVNPSA